MRLSTGVPGFDELIDGGLSRDRLYIVSGPPGSGKTTFCTQVLTKGVFNDEMGLPSSLQGYRIDTRPDDSRERVRRPDFLE